MASSRRAWRSRFRGSAARIEPWRAVMLALELGEQLALPRRRMVSDLPAEMRRLAPALEELVDELVAQRGIAGRADEHELVVLPELEHARRIRRRGDERGNDEPFRAPDRHGAQHAPHALRQAERFPSAAVSVFAAHAKLRKGAGAFRTHKRR